VLAKAMSIVKIGQRLAELIPDVKGKGDVRY